MKPFTPVAITVAIAGMCCVAAASFCTYYYVRFQAGADMDARLKTLESRVDGLTFTVRDRWATRKIWSRIVTEDINSTESKSFALRLTSKTNSVQRFQLDVGKEYGQPVAAWVSDWKPRDDMMKFEQFDVVPTGTNRFIEVLVEPKAGATIDMEFTVSVLIQRFEQN